MAPCLEMSAASIRQASMAMSWVADEHDHALAYQHPRTAMPEPAVENGYLRAVDERRPEEFEGRDQRDQAEEADHFERVARSTQPGRQRVEDQKIGKGGRKPQRQHDQRAPFGEDGECRRGLPARRHEFSFSAHVAWLD